MADEATQQDTAVDDFGLGVETGEISPVAIVDMAPTFDDVTTADDVAAEAQAWLASQQATVAPDVYTAMQETLDPLTDAVNDGIVPPTQARYFFFWLAYSAGVTLIPAAGIYAFVQGYVVKWAQQNGWATMGPNPVATPLAQAFIESANAASPLPGTVNPPAVLPSPSVGQSTVGAAAKEVQPQTVQGTGLSPSAAAQVQAAIGVAAADLLKAQAAVIDAMLPNLAPGQTTEALNQLNTAVNALENQMQQVRNGEWPRGYQGALQALNGGLEALHGLSQEVGILANQIAEKADSALEDGITAVKQEADGTAAEVATIVGTTIPELAGGLQTLTGTVGDLANQVTNQVLPELGAQEEAIQAAAAKLALTDDACLEALCDSIENVTQPIEQGGATPGLLSQLGSLLTRALEIGGLLSLVETLVTLANTQVAVNAIVADTETITGWATQAASVIEADFSLSGWD